MTVEEDKIINALRDQRWDYRTVEGIAKETDISVETVRAFLESRRNIVWRFSVPDRRGRVRAQRCDDGS